ncbi:MAG: hypothetical protein U1A78_20545 [Polyangia bacterium]
MKPPAGIVVSGSDGDLVRVAGLAEVQSGELLALPGGERGWALQLLRDSVLVARLGPRCSLRPGEAVLRQGRLLQLRTGPALRGRIVDPLGNPLDDGPVPTGEPRSLLTGPLHPGGLLAPREPLWTGVKPIDLLSPVRRGGCKALVGPARSGKTTLALTAILNQRASGIRCVYVSIGQELGALARLTALLRSRGALAHTTVVAATATAPLGVQVLAPLAGAVIAAACREAGEHVLLVQDDCARQLAAARALGAAAALSAGPRSQPVRWDGAELLSRALAQVGALPAERGGSVTALAVHEPATEQQASPWPSSWYEAESASAGCVVLRPRHGALDALRLDLVRSSPLARSGGLLTGWGNKLVPLLQAYERLGTAHPDQKDGLVRQGGPIAQCAALHALLAQPPLQPVPVAEQVAVLCAGLWGALTEREPARLAAQEAALLEFLRAEQGALLAEIERCGGLRGPLRVELQEALRRFVPPR